jgi:hypothetical protein
MTNDAKAAEHVTLLAAATGGFLTPFMGSAVTLALPAIAAEFGLDAVSLGWVRSAFLRAASALLLPINSLVEPSCRLGGCHLALREPYHEHGYLGLSQNRFRDRAEQEPAETAPAVRRHGDDVSSGLPRRRYDLRHGLPTPDVDRHSHTLPPQISGHRGQVLARLVQPRRDVVDGEVGCALDGLRHDWLHRIDEPHLQIERARDLKDEGRLARRMASPGHVDRPSWSNRPVAARMSNRRIIGFPL